MSETEKQITDENESQNQSAEAPAAEAPAEEAARAARGIVARVRQAGDTGRKQWEQLFARARALRDDDLPRLRKEAEEAYGRLRRDGPFVRAQLRGTELLLRVVGRVRESATTLEQNLREHQIQPEAPAAA